MGRPHRVQPGGTGGGGAGSRSLLRAPPGGGHTCANGRVCGRGWTARPVGAGWGALVPDRVCPWRTPVAHPIGCCGPRSSGQLVGVGLCMASRPVLSSPTSGCCAHTLRGGCARVEGRVMAVRGHAPPAQQTDARRWPTKDHRCLSADNVAADGCPVSGHQREITVRQR